MLHFFEKDLVLETERLIIRPLNGTDRSFIKELYNPNNVPYLDSKVKSQEYREKYVEFSIYLRDRKTRIDLVLIDKNTGAKIGVKQLNFMCLVKPLGFWRGHEIQYDGFVYTNSVVLPEYRGKGYMTEATSSIMIYLFENKVRAIVCDIDSRNSSSISYNTRLGFMKVSLHDFNDLDKIGTAVRGDSLEETYAYVYTPNYKRLKAKDLLYKVKNYPEGKPPISF